MSSIAEFGRKFDEALITTTLPAVTTTRRLPDIVMQSVLNIRPSKAAPKIVETLLAGVSSAQQRNQHICCGVHCNRIARLYIEAIRREYSEHGERGAIPPVYVTRTLKLIKTVTTVFLAKIQNTSNLGNSDWNTLLVAYEFICAFKRFIVASDSDKDVVAKPLVAFRFLRKTSMFPALGLLVKFSLIRTLRDWSMTPNQSEDTWEEIRTCLRTHPDLGACILKSVQECEKQSLVDAAGSNRLRKELGMAATLNTQADDLEELLDFETILKDISEGDITVPVVAPAPLILPPNPPPAIEMNLEAAADKLCASSRTRPSWARDDGKTLYSYFKIQKSQLSCLAKNVKITFPFATPLQQLTSSPDNTDWLLCTEPPL